MRRCLLLGVAAGLTSGAALGAAGVSVWWAVVVGLLLAACGWWSRSAAFLWAAAFVGGMALPQPGEAPPYLLHQLPLMQEARARVVGMPEPRARSTEALVELEGHPRGVRLLAYLPVEAEVGPGDLVRLEGRGARPRPPEWERHLLRRGVHGLFLAERVEVIERSGWGLLRWAYRARHRLLGRLEVSLSDEGASFLSALLLGVRGMLPGSNQEAFRRAGVAHLLALSGLHLGLLVAGGWWLLRLLRLSPPVRYAVLVILVSCYVLMAGARVSLVRAAIMFGCAGAFWVLWEKGWVLRQWLDPLQPLALAAVIIVVIWPWSPADTAFQLSFLATGAILVLLPGWMESGVRAQLPKWSLRAADLVAVSSCAQAGALPVVGSTFGYVAAFGLLANLLLVPWTGLLLWAGVGVLALGPPGGSVVEKLVLTPYLAVVHRLAALPGAELSVGTLFSLWCAAAAFGILVLRAALEELDGRLVGGPARQREGHGRWSCERRGRSLTV